MNRKLLAALTVVTLAAAPAALSAQISTGISLAAGLSLPGSGNDFSRDFSSGYNAAVGLNIGAPLLPVGVRIEGGYNGFEAKNMPTGSSGNVKILSGTVNATAGLGLPYVIGGLGYYSRKLEAKSGTLTANDSQSAVGLNGGVGMRFPLGALSTFAEIRYHKMMGDSAKGADLSYIPITFGIQF